MKFAEVQLDEEQQAFAAEARAWLAANLMASRV